MSKNYTYKCPHCKKEQDMVIQWQTASVKYINHFKSGNCEQKEIEGGDHEAFCCYNCGEDLPTEMWAEIFDNL